MVAAFELFTSYVSSFTESHVDKIIMLSPTFGFVLRGPCFWKVTGRQLACFVDVAQIMMIIKFIQLTQVTQ